MTETDAEIRRVVPDSITTTGCRLVFSTWADSVVWSAWATWIAIGV